MNMSTKTIKISIDDLIDKFNLKNDNVLKKREKEEDAKIDEIYEKLRIRAKN